MFDVFLVRLGIAGRAEVRRKRMAPWRLKIGIALI